MTYTTTDNENKFERPRALSPEALVVHGIKVERVTEIEAGERMANMSINAVQARQGLVNAEAVKAAMGGEPVLNYDYLEAKIPGLQAPQVENTPTSNTDIMQDARQQLSKIFG